MLRPPLNLLGMLGAPCFHLLSPLRTPFGTVAITIIGVGGATPPAFRGRFLILGDGRHRRSTGEQKGKYEFAHLDTPAETSPLMRRFSAPDYERTLNELRCFG
jgi:hypothetical protein